MEKAFDFTKALAKHDRDENYKVLIQKYNTKSFFDIIGKGRSETMHSAFVAWLLGSKELVSSTGELSPLRSFLALLLNRCEKLNVDEEDYRTSIRNEITTALLSKSLTNVNVETEKALKLSESKTGQDGKVKTYSVTDKADIFITFELGETNNTEERCNKYVILIENKVGSEEEGAKKTPKDYKGYDRDAPISVYCSKNQTDRYYSILTNKEWGDNSAPYNEYKDYIKIFVFLTPFYDERKAQEGFVEFGREMANNNHYINVNYQDLLNYCIYPFSNYNYISDKNRLLLEEYIQCLSLSTLEEKTKNKYIVMASTKEEKEYIEKYYNSHTSLLLNAVCVANPTKELSVDSFCDNISNENQKYLKLFYDRNKSLIMVALKECNPDVYDDLFRDNTKFYFTDADDNKKYGKGKFYYECVRRYINNLGEKVEVQDIENQFNHPVDMEEVGDYPIDRLNVVYGKRGDKQIEISDKSQYKVENENVIFKESSSNMIRAFKLDFSDNRYYKDPIKINEEDEGGFFVTTQWGEGCFHTFWDWAKKKIKYVKSSNSKAFSNE